MTLMSYCKRSKTGGVEGLGMRLGKPVSLTVCTSLTYIAELRFVFVLVPKDIEMSREDCEDGVTAWSTLFEGSYW